MRKSLRLPAFDYSSNNAYFITICTFNRRPILVEENKAIVEAEFGALPERFSGVAIDLVMLMPDHVHAILLFTEAKTSLSSVVQAFKS
jgi:putative transposase